VVEIDWEGIVVRLEHSFVVTRKDDIAAMFNLRLQVAPTLLNETRRIFAFLAYTRFCITVTRLPAVGSGLTEALDRMKVSGLAQPAR
jgi:hypothetical protein